MNDLLHLFIFRKPDSRNYPHLFTWPCRNFGATERFKDIAILQSLQVEVLHPPFNCFAEGTNRSYEGFNRRQPTHHLATNIAESSLTVPNVEYVIDFCLCKTLIASRQGYNMTYLSLEWSSKSSSDQRAGRTGRTNHGQVFRLIPNHFYQTLNEYEIPEFEKTPLENYVLKAKLIDDHIPPKNVLAFALNPPKLNDIEQAVLTPKRIGAFTVYMQEEREEEAEETEDGEKPSEVEKGQLALVVAEEREEREERRPDKKEEVKYIHEKEDGNLTALGYIMALLPLDIMLSKLVALGLVFDVSFETIVIAAAHCTSGLLIDHFKFLNSQFTSQSIFFW